MDRNLGESTRMDRNSRGIHRNKPEFQNSEGFQGNPGESAGMNRNSGILRDSGGFWGNPPSIHYQKHNLKGTTLCNYLFEGLSPLHFF